MHRTIRRKRLRWLRPGHGDVSKGSARDSFVEFSLRHRQSFRLRLEHNPDSDLETLRRLVPRIASRRQVRLPKVGMALPLRSGRFRGLEGVYSFASKGTPALRRKSTNRQDGHRFIHQCCTIAKNTMVRYGRTRIPRPTARIPQQRGRLGGTADNPNSQGHHRRPPRHRDRRQVFHPRALRSIFRLSSGLRFAGFVWLWDTVRKRSIPRRRIHAFPTPCNVRPS